MQKSEDISLKAKLKRKRDKHRIKEIERNIDFLYENTPYYCVDSVPKTFSSERIFKDGYFDWDDEKNLPDFADKIVEITFALINYDYAEIYLPVSRWPKNKGKFHKYVGWNIRKLDYPTLEEIIKHIILKWQGKMIIVFTDQNHQEFYMDIRDEWETTFLNLRGHNLELVRQLVKSKGLFLPKIENDLDYWKDLEKSWQDKNYKRWKKLYKK